MKRTIDYYYKRFVEKSLFFLEEVYRVLRLDEGVSFFYFLFHRYRVQQFNPLYFRKNLQLMARAGRSLGLTSNGEGELKILSSKTERFWFALKNILCCGALQSRVERVVHFSCLTVTLEFHNPFTKEVLDRFLERKIAFLEALLRSHATLNGKRWDQTEIQKNISIYLRSSLIQAEVIRSMQVALRRQKKHPVLQEIERGIKKGIQPILSIIGVSGAYWMRGANREILGLFKPFDEDIKGPNNPTGPKNQGALGLRRVRAGCRVGESAHHEVAAFLVDAFFGFGIVPRTYYACFTHSVFFSSNEKRFALRGVEKKKMGSFQEFLDGFVSLDKITNEEDIPVEEYQLLVLLDVIIGNTDRNIGNILVGDQKIAAIDNGLCFPESTYELSYWYWSSCSQGKHPLHPVFLDLLTHFPFEKLAWKLRKRCFVSWTALERMRERVALFAAGVGAGLAPKDLEGLMKEEYLNPLCELDLTLADRAKEQVNAYRMVEKPKLK